RARRDWRRCLQLAAVTADSQRSSSAPWLSRTASTSSRTATLGAKLMRWRQPTVPDFPTQTLPSAVQSPLGASTADRLPKIQQLVAFGVAASIHEIIREISCAHQIFSPLSWAETRFGA